MPRSKSRKPSAPEGGAEPRKTPARPKKTSTPSRATLRPRAATAGRGAKAAPTADELSLAEQRWLRVIDRTADGILLFEPASLRVVEANRAFAELLGATTEELRSLSVLDFVDHEPESVRSNVDACVREGRKEVGERRFRRRDGVVVDVEVSVALVPTTTGPLCASIVRDVTERRRVQRELAASEERFRLISIAANDAVWDWDLQSDTIWYSDGLRAQFGWEGSEVRPDSAWWWERIWAADRDRVVGELHAVINGGESAWSDEYRFRRGDGSHASVFDRGYVIRDDRGKPIRMVGARMDITSRVRTEQELRRLSREHRLIVEATAEGIIGTDRFGRVTFANAASLRMTGWIEGELVGRPLHSVIHHSKIDGTPFAEDDCPSWEALRSGLHRRVKGEYFWRRDGAPFPVEYVVAPIREGRDIIGCVLSFRDVTTEARLEEERADSDARLRALLAAVPDLMFRITRSGRFVDYNAPRFSVLYTPPEAFIGRNIADVLPGEVARRTLEVIAQALDEGRVQQFEYDLDMPGGTTRYEARAVRCTETDALVVCRQISP